MNTPSDTPSVYPAHPDVDWGTLRKAPGIKTTVDIRCPICGDVRSQPAGMIKYRIGKGTFSGRCHKDRLVRKPRRDRIGTEVPHPAVDWNDFIIKESREHRVVHVRVVCPTCQAGRYMLPGTIRHQLRLGRFTGNCQRCGGMQNRKNRNPALTRTDPKGYVRLTRAGIDPADYWLFDAMNGGRNGLAEHRFVMAKHLGRPLTSAELVDHMDGTHGNNDISNLRIYRKGKNDPGSHNGNGTYYHEWQAALAEIDHLKKLLDSHSS